MPGAHSIAAVALADASDHPYSRDLVNLFAAVLALDQRDEQRLRTAPCGSCRERAWTDRAAPVESFAGFVDVLDGRWPHGLDRIRRVVGDEDRDDEGRDESGAPGEHGLHLRILLEACAVTGDADAGLAAADRALRSGGAPPWEPEVRRLRGEFLHAAGASRSDVEAELRRAEDARGASRGAPVHGASPTIVGSVQLSGEEHETLVGTVRERLAINHGSR